MLVLVIGGAGSGKSQFAESLAARPDYDSRIYVATMLVKDDEGRERALRHQSMRADKNFVTVEASENLSQLTVSRGASVLLEDLSNLTANEFFSKKGQKRARDRIIDGIDHIHNQAELFVIVSNDLFSDGITYDLYTNEYLDLLSQLNCCIAQKADVVYEVVCGVPVLWKGDGLL